MSQSPHFKLHEALCNLCRSTGWSYTVFWRLRPRAFPREVRQRTNRSGEVIQSNAANKEKGNWVLMWEDGFSLLNSLSQNGNSLEGVDFSDIDMDVLPTTFSKMSYQLYNYGEGLIGKVALRGNHRWVLRDEISPTTPSSVLDNQNDQFPSGWKEQFDAGIQTIAVIAVPQGVIQLGSLLRMNEDSSFIQKTRDVFSSLAHLVNGDSLGQRTKPPRSLSGRSSPPGLSQSLDLIGSSQTSNLPPSLPPRSLSVPISDRVVNKFSNLNIPKPNPASIMDSPNLFLGNGKQNEHFSPGSFSKRGFNSDEGESNAFSPPFPSSTMPNPLVSLKAGGRSSSWPRNRSADMGVIQEMAERLIGHKRASPMEDLPPNFNTLSSFINNNPSITAAAAAAAAVANSMNENNNNNNNSNNNNNNNNNNSNNNNNGNKNNPSPNSSKHFCSQIQIPSDLSPSPSPSPTPTANASSLFNLLSKSLSLPNSLSSETMSLLSSPRLASALLEHASSSPASFPPELAQLQRLLASRNNPSSPSPSPLSPLSPSSLAKLISGLLSSKGANSPRANLASMETSLDSAKPNSQVSLHGIEGLNGGNKTSGQEAASKANANSNSNSEQQLLSAFSNLVSGINTTLGQLPSQSQSQKQILQALELGLKLKQSSGGNTASYDSYLADLIHKNFKNLTHEIQLEICKLLSKASTEPAGMMNPEPVADKLKQFAMKQEIGSVREKEMRFQYLKKLEMERMEKERTEKERVEKEMERQKVEESRMKEIRQEQLHQLQLLQHHEQMQNYNRMMEMKNVNHPHPHPLHPSNPSQSMASATSMDATSSLSQRLFAGKLLNEEIRSFMGNLLSSRENEMQASGLGGMEEMLKRGMYREEGRSSSPKPFALPSMAAPSFFPSRTNSNPNDLSISSLLENSFKSHNNTNMADTNMDMNGKIGLVSPQGGLFRSISTPNPGEYNPQLLPRIYNLSTPKPSGGSVINTDLNTNMNANMNMNVNMNMNASMDALKPNSLLSVGKILSNASDDSITNMRSLSVPMQDFPYVNDDVEGFDWLTFTPGSRPGQQRSKPIPNVTSENTNLNADAILSSLDSSMYQEVRSEPAQMLPLPSSSSSLSTSALSQRNASHSPNSSQLSTSPGAVKNATSEFSNPQNDSRAMSVLASMESNGGQNQSQSQSQMILSSQGTFEETGNQIQSRGANRTSGLVQTYLGPNPNPNPTSDFDNASHSKKGDFENKGQYRGSFQETTGGLPEDATNTSDFTMMGGTLEDMVTWPSTPNPSLNLNSNLNPSSNSNWNTDSNLNTDSKLNTIPSLNSLQWLDMSSPWIDSVNAESTWNNNGDSMPSDFPPMDMR